MISFKNETIVVIDPVVVVERGDEVRTYPDDAPEREVDGCRVQPLAGEEVRFSGADEGGTARSAVVYRRKVFAPYDAEIGPHNRIRYGGDVFAVDGPVERWRSGTGTLAHTEFVVRRVTG